MGKNRELQQVIENQEIHYIVDVYLYVSDRLTSENIVQPGDFKKKEGRLGIVPVVLHPTTIEAISSVQVFLPQNHKAADKTVELTYFEVMKRLEGGVPLLDPLDDMQIESKTLDKLLQTKASLKKELDASDIQKLSSD
jgi:hypothetical protein